MRALTPEAGLGGGRWEFHEAPSSSEPSCARNTGVWMLFRQSSVGGCGPGMCRMGQSMGLVSKFGQWMCEMAMGSLTSEEGELPGDRARE